MYLKNLSVLGFKSFADKTSLNFQRGITAIVGPNGCGKSNVADAIRWVLGEQSAKALRGGGMADVIFSGTDRRKAMAMAEVSITVGDVDDGQLRAAGVDVTFNELTITRRIFRDGGSEYFINKVPCRLRDIQQVFLGTGVGRTSYSIMAQGNITRIIQSKPEERRVVFEEAAGITRFKAQKIEALRKLDHTDQNLLRLEDLLREVKRQIGSLQRQAGKARRYRELMIQLQHLETQLARHHFDVLTNEMNERRQRAEALRSEMETCSGDVLREEDEIHVLRDELTGLDRQIGSAQQRGLELKAAAEQHESRIQYNEQRLAELEEQNAQALSEISQSEERITAAREELNAVTARLAHSEGARAEKEQGVAARREALQAVESGLSARQESLRQAQSAAFAVSQQLSRLRNELNALELQKQGNTIRLEKLSAEKIQLEEERVALDRRLTEFSSNVEQRRQDVVNQRGTIEERQQRAAEFQQEINTVGAALDEALRARAEKRSRFEVLDQLDQAHEGFSEGALAALKRSDGVLGSLADKLRVPDSRHIPAVEAALGQQLQLVLTGPPETARQILADLQAGKLGRASVAALGLGLAESGGDISDGPGERVVDLIEADESVRPLLRALLSHVRLVPDLNAATQAWRDCGGRFDFVTATGELLSRAGVFTGGDAKGNGAAASSVLGRKNEIVALRAELARIQEQVEEHSRRKGGLQGELTAVQAGLQQAQSELRRQEVAIATNEGEFNALQNSRRNLEQRIDTVVYEIQSLAEQEQEGAGKRIGLQAQAAEIDGKEKEAQALVVTLTAAIEELRGGRDAAQNALSEARVELAAEQQLNDSLKRQQGPLEQRIREFEALIQRRQGELGSFLERRARTEGDITRSRGEIERLQHDRGQVSGQINELVEHKTGQEQNVQAREESLRGRRQRLNELQEARGALDVELAQKEMSVNNLREKIQQKYHLRIEDIQGECITITYADSGPARIETLSPEEMEQSGASTDWEAVAGQVEALQERIDQMGPVNLVAIEEYEETEQRFTFLTQQHDDLVKAKTELLEIINRINVQTREMFAETFEKIRQNFQELFTEIFGGGKADLVLVDESDLLESGVDIVARPPGKKLQSITLLSGGEQTMTAVALLFAIYQVKPSPFAVLDELDAPLDESNINRFLRVVQRFLDRSQFVIITHNKRTIGMADVLYGVTMQEHGVSKVVSVKFHKDQKPEEMVAHGKPLVPPPANGTNAQIEAVEDTPHRKEETLELAAVE